MYQCPVCGKENTSLICAACGFDTSKDYEGYPTLAPLPPGIPSRGAAGKNLEDMHRCEGCGGLLFYLNPAKGICVCAKCSREVPVGTPTSKPVSIPPVVIPTPPTKRVTAVPAPAKPAAKKVNTFQTYMQALEQLYLDKGKRPLTQYEIADFMKAHQLTARYNIRAADVQKDLAAIYNKYAPKKEPEAISTYDQYMQALEQLYIQNNKSPLSSYQILSFITTNSLDKKFQVTASDVRKDLAAIAEKHKQYSNLSKVLQQKSSQDTKSLGNVLSQLMKKK